MSSVKKKVCQVKSRRRAAGAAAARCSGRERGAERIRAAELVSCCGGRFSISSFWPPRLRCLFALFVFELFVFVYLLRFSCHVPSSRVSPSPALSDTHGPNMNLTSASCKKKKFERTRLLRRFSKSLSFHRGSPVEAPRKR